MVIVSSNCRLEETEKKIIWIESKDEFTNRILRVFTSATRLPDNPANILFQQRQPNPSLYDISCLTCSTHIPLLSHACMHHCMILLLNISSTLSHVNFLFFWLYVLIFWEKKYLSLIISQSLTIQLNLILRMNKICLIL